jgi:hypothetical protein
MERFVKTLEDVKKMEEKMAAQREEFKKELLESVRETLGYLEQLGLHYELVEKNGAAPAKRLGRPRKEKTDGLVQ